MLENKIEKRLVQGVQDIGGVAYKFVCPGHAGVPDRLVCMPGGRACFVELKAPGKKPRPLQVSAQGRLKDLGFVVETLDCVEQVDSFCEWLREVVK